MTFSSYEKRFTDLAKKRNYSSEVITKCLSYAEPLIRKKVPVIYNIAHFSSHVGYTVKYIKRAIKHTDYFYRHYEISKKNGGKRKISEPLPSLQEIQNFILTKILYKQKVSRYSKAYVPGRSILMHAKYHVNNHTVLTIDLKDFFSSIRTHHIEAIFKEIGYSQIVSNMLAKICTLNGGLPQGASTSPALSNIFFSKIDELIAKEVRPEINYTRYADDLAFSGETIDKEVLVTKVQSILEPYELKINASKTKLMTQHQQQIITGIVVNKKLQLPSKDRRKIRQELYYIKKYNMASHMSKKNIHNKKYAARLLGKINFALLLNPKDKEFIEYKKVMHEIIQHTI